MAATSAQSPIARDALERALLPFGEAALLPVSAYLDESVFQWEMAQLFESGWSCVGRSTLLPDPGAQFAAAVGRTSVLLVRDEDHQLRAFANTCRHGGHELLACGASTSRGVVQCPYHAWSYGLDGALRIAPRAGDAIDLADRGLVGVAVAEWAGWVFVDLMGRAGPFAAHLGDFAGLVEPWDPAPLVPGAADTYEVAGNWKLVAENYHECYHCPLIHPELCRVTDAGSGRNVREAAGDFLGGGMATAAGAATMSMTGALVGTLRPGLDETQRHSVVYVQLFPNLMIALHPDYVLTHRLEPLSAGRTRIECEWLFAPDDVARPGFDPHDAVELWDRTNRQDWAAVESVQRGMSSPLHRPGVLAHDEDAVYQFVAMVASAHLGLPLSRGAVPADYRR